MIIVILGGAGHAGRTRLRGARLARAGGDAWLPFTEHWQLLPRAAAHPGGAVRPRRRLRGTVGAAGEGHEREPDPRASRPAEALRRPAGHRTTCRLAPDAGRMPCPDRPNGAGKTTLLSLLRGALTPDGGRDALPRPRHHPAGRAARARAAAWRARSRSPPCSGPCPSVDNVALGVQARAGHSLPLSGPRARDRSPAGARAGGAGAGRAGRAGAADRRASELAHGQKRQLEIAMALATEPSVLLLDEPMAGMGSAESEVIIALLEGLRSRYAVLLVEHDMGVVFRLADRLTRTGLRRVIASGTP
ncbi:MAG: ATP-binding cassette domain-containing protein [Arhodomonas sp.]|nr:ATP-binding cassette domain-containing protein [Arhodomonas sp.]